MIMMNLSNMISNQSQNATSEWLTIDTEIQSGKECKRKKE